MIPGEIGRELASALAAGELPDAAAGVGAAGTWRPAPPADGGGPGTYASSSPFALARVTGYEADWLAGKLAGALAGVSWIAAARVTGDGYLTVTVTVGHLAGLAGRIVAAGSPGEPLSPPDLSACGDWMTAWETFRGVVTGRLSSAAGLGAGLGAGPDQRGGRGSHDGPGPREPHGSPAGPVRAAFDYHGGDAVRYALARNATGGAGAIARQLNFPLDLSNPFVLVRYAHADSASAPRWAAELGLAADSGEGWAPVPEPAEAQLLDRLSWYPERLRAAARRRRPAELAAYLEALAGDWLSCRESCPALAFGGETAPADPGLIGWRLRLAAAARAVLGSGLRLLSVSAPERM